MAKQKKTPFVYIVLIIGIVLIGIGWLLFYFLSANSTDQSSDQDFKKAARIQAVKRLAEENLIFFPPDEDQQDILSKLQSNPQYEELDLEIDTFIDLYNPGNPYPFKVPESAE
jgi:flagellar basal body-associated protein FliL